MGNRANITILDSLRAFAAISVCLYHFICTTTGFIQNEIILDVFSIGKYGVQLFFVISGFVIPWAMYNAGYKFSNFFSFFLKRLARLEPPYLFSILFVLLILYLRERLLGRENDHMDVSTKQVLLHLGYLIPWFNKYHWLNQVYWTLAIEFQYYLFIALLFVPLVKTKILGRVIIYCGIILLSFIGSSEFLPFWLPVFMLGVILFLFKSSLIRNSEYYSSSLILLIICVFKYSLLSTIYVSLPLISILFWQDIKIPLLDFFGKFSYSIYLIHPTIGASLINILSHYATAPYQKIGIVLLGLAVTLVGARIMYSVIEKRSKILSSSITYQKTQNFIKANEN